MRMVPTIDILRRIESLRSRGHSGLHQLFHGDLRRGLDLLGRDGVAHLITGEPCACVAERLPDSVLQALEVLPELHHATYWKLTQDAIVKYFGQFLGETPDAPGFFIVHGLSWSDRLVRSTYYRDSLSIERSRGEWLPNGDFVLQLDHMGIRQIQLNGRSIPWLAAQGLDADVDGLVKVIHSNRTLTPTNRVTSASYREQIGVAPPDEQSSALVLNGLHPGVRRRLFTPAQQPAREPLSLLPWGPLDIESPQFSAEKAILDLGILQVHRMRLINPGDLQSLVVIEELTFAVDRPTGLVAYVALATWPFGDGQGLIPEVALQALWQQGRTDT